MSVASSTSMDRSWPLLLAQEAALIPAAPPPITSTSTLTGALKFTAC